LVLHAAPDVSGTARLKRELLRLIVVVLLVDGVFILVYRLTPLHSASGMLKLGYTVLWTGVILVLVLRGLLGIRALRVRRALRPR
jgi:hypothetical protein